MLTPAEELGLAGAVLDARVRRAVSYIPDSTLAHLERRLAADALREEVVYERDGRIEPVRIMLRPLLVMPEQVAYLHRVCTRIVDALKGLPEFWMGDPRLQALVLHERRRRGREPLEPLHPHEVLDAVVGRGEPGARVALRVVGLGLREVGLDRRHLLGAEEPLDVQVARLLEEGAQLLVGALRPEARRDHQ